MVGEPPSLEGLCMCRLCWMTWMAVTSGDTRTAEDRRLRRRTRHHTGGGHGAGREVSEKRRAGAASGGGRETDPLLAIWMMTSLTSAR